MNQKQLQILCEQISLEYFGKRFLHIVRFNNRLRTTGGRYLLKSHDIEINPKYYFEQGIEAVKAILKHELCHYHLHIEGKGYQHKDEDFKRLLKKVDGPRYCKPLSTVKRKKQLIKYIYECGACKQTYNRKRRMDTTRYVCGSCRGKLILKENLQKIVDDKK
ncbi:MAG TPA: SprT family protein [Bacillus bacterium]|nr:SprT family protein [Bacillus sp. (in: firmicutes)]